MSGVVVDTSVWIDFLAGRPSPALEEALTQGVAVLPDPEFQRSLRDSMRDVKRGRYLTFAELKARLANKKLA